MPGGIPDNGFFAFWAKMLGDTIGENLLDLFHSKEGELYTHPSYQNKVINLKGIKVPTLVCMSYSDHGLHTNGSFRAFREISSKDKWLYTHRTGKWAAFYSDEAVALQKQFLDYFLQNKTNNGMNQVPRVRIEVVDYNNHVHKVLRFKDPVYPVKETIWKKGFFNANGTIGDQVPMGSGALEKVELDALSGCIAFKKVFGKETIVSGPMKLELTLSSSNLVDMNLFAFVRKLDQHGNEVHFEGCTGYGLDVVTKGWQRLALRKPFDAYSEIWDADKPFDCNEPFPTDGRKVLVSVAMLPSSTFYQKGSSMEVVLQGRWMLPVGPLSQFCNYLPSTIPGVLEVWCGGVVEGQGSSILFGILENE
ncbi:hypothetical protein HDU76_011130 [Blyttiomyces sp. JEL0837]|nr:hypothetical protein HDU76_011130 [Blyttiomyces sp. JEL0837]